MKRNQSVVRRAAWLLAGLALVAGFTFVVVRSQALPDGPRPVVWDQQTCAECRMTVSDRRFACQLQTTDGRVLDFDDPGCLFHYLSEDAPPVRALYFHAFDGDRWLDRDRVGFITGARGPMGYDLAAVAAGRTGALDFEAARARALTEEDSHVPR